MTTDPLHIGPVRPRCAKNGRLTNPIGPDPLKLDPGRPLRYSDLHPTTAYTDGHFEYLTDEDAMPARVRGILRLVSPADIVRHTSVQAEVGHIATASGRWQGGHIIAVSLGGFASGPNLFPQSGNFNQSAYSRLEHGWRDAIRDGVTVGVDIALTEGSETQVPEFLIVTFWEDDHEDHVALLNEPRAQ